jgi:hypothetical protein
MTIDLLTEDEFVDVKTPEPAKRVKPRSHAKNDSAIAVKRGLRSVDKGEEVESQEMRDSQ